MGAPAGTADRRVANAADLISNLRVHFEGLATNKKIELDISVRDELLQDTAQTCDQVVIVVHRGTQNLERFLPFLCRLSQPG